MSNILTMFLLLLDIPNHAAMLFVVFVVLMIICRDYKSVANVMLNVAIVIAIVTAIANM